MRRTVFIPACALFSAVFLASGMHASADDKNKGFDSLEKLNQPGPQHKLLQSLAGSWTYTCEIWLEPGKPSLKSKGTAERKMILSGRFLEEKLQGTFAGMPFHGLALNGYDNIQGKYVGTWIDNMSTGILTSTGSADATGKVITFEREEFDPVTKVKSKGRDVLRIVGDDKEVTEYYKTLPDGKEYKMMEIVYTRTK